MSQTGWFVMGLCICTAASLYFAMMMLAVSSFSRAKLQETFRQLGRPEQFENFIQHLEPLLLTCGFFRIAFNAAIIFLLVHLFSDHHYLLTFLIALVILEMFNLIVPYSWAKHAAQYILPRNWPLLRALMWVIKPILSIFYFHDRFVRRLAGVPENDPEVQQEEKQEEILSIVEQSQKEGIVDEDQVEMIENVLELSETTAGQIMTPRTDIIAVPVNASLQEVLQLISHHGHSRLPVYEGTIDNIIGLIFAKDLLEQIGNNNQPFDLRSKLRTPYFVPESKPLRALLREFQTQSLHMAVVLDEYGGTAGIVTIEDILEELVGEIADEFEKPETEPLKKIDDITFELDARMYIDDVNRQLDIELPEDEDYDTVGGFVFSYLGYIPKTGEAFDYKDLSFTIVGADSRSIKRIRIQKKTPQATS